MTCLDSSIASPWEFAAFWCQSAIRYGVDNGGGVFPGNANLTDTSASFQSLGVEPNVGMVLYNLTRNTSGLITAVSDTTITATGVLWVNGDRYRVTTMTGDEASQIQLFLDITAPDIYAALASVAACDCTWTAWGTALVKKLNIIEAAVFHSCPCSSIKLSDEQKTAYMEFFNLQMTKIVTGEIDICGGTGKDFPSLDWAESAGTDFAAANIITNDILRHS